jgi:shikimate kinase
MEDKFLYEAIMSESNKRNIILCGFMATGKSTVGKKLAALMNYQFMDLDAVIEEEEGISIPEIFTSRGEPAFRALESRMVERVSAMNGRVIATGGGTIVNPQNLEKLKSCGVVITLTADIATILQRVGSGDDRPMLKGDRVERIRTLLEQRAYAYSQADIVLDTTSLSIEEVAQTILARLLAFGLQFEPAGENSRT